MKPQLKMTPKRHWMFVLALLALSLLAAPNAFGEVTDTDAGDQIDNIATIVYQVGGAGQDPVTSNTASFVVDHKVRPRVVQAADDTAVPGGTDEYLTFTVTNDGNTNSTAPADLLHMRLTVEEVASPADDFNAVADSIRIYRENSLPANTTFDGDDVLITDYAGADSYGTISLGRDQSVTVYVVANIPTGLANTNFADIHLIATAWDTAGQDVGAALGQDPDGIDDPMAMEVVWADVSGPATGDGDFGGFHSATARYTIQTATLGVTKSSSVESDPFGNVAPNAYRVPGARVQYDIVVNNTGPVDASSLQVVDQIPAGTDYINASAASTAGVTSVEYSDDTTTVFPTLPTDWTYVPTWDANGVDANITWIRITLTNAVTASGGSATTSFDVFIR